VTPAFGTASARVNGLRVLWPDWLRSPHAAQNQPAGPAPSRVAYGYPHMRKAATSPACTRRKYEWVTKIISQANMAPNKEIAIISVKAVFGNSMLGTVSSAILIDDSSNSLIDFQQARRMERSPREKGLY
jgi:hypothetical protein